MSWSGVSAPPRELFVRPISSLAWVVTSSRSSGRRSARPPRLISIVQRLTAAISLPIRSLDGRSCWGVRSVPTSSATRRLPDRPAAPRRHRPVRRQARGPRAAAAVRAGDGDRRPATPGARGRTADRVGRTRSRWCTNRSWTSARFTSRGSKRWPLEPPGTWRRPSRRVHPDRRGDRPHHAARQVGPRDGMSPTRRLAPTTGA